MCASGRPSQQVLRRGPPAIVVFAACTAALLIPSAPSAAQARPEARQERAATASLGGIVLDARTRLPLRDALITVRDAADSAVSDERGRFELVDLAPGPRIIQLVYRGRRTAPRDITLEPSRHTDIRVALVVPGDETPRNVVTLPPLEVEIITSDWTGKMRGFYRRARSGRGTFITRDDIDVRNANQTSDLLRDVAGLRISSRPGGDRVTSNRGCLLVLFLDGHPMPGMSPDDVPLGDIEGIEVYGSTTETPSLFRRVRGCGALVIWTRDP